MSTDNVCDCSWQGGNYIPGGKCLSTPTNGRPRYQKYIFYRQAQVDGFKINIDLSIVFLAVVSRQIKRSILTSRADVVMGRNARGSPHATNEPKHGRVARVVGVRAGGSGVVRGFAVLLLNCVALRHGAAGEWHRLRAHTSSRTCGCGAHVAEWCSHGVSSYTAPIGFRCLWPEKKSPNLVPNDTDVIF